MGDQKVRGEPLCEGWDRGGRVHKPSTGPITGQDTERGRPRPFRPGSRRSDQRLDEGAADGIQHSVVGNLIAVSIDIPEQNPASRHDAYVAPSAADLEYAVATIGFHVPFRDVEVFFKSVYLKYDRCEICALQVGLEGVAAFIIQACNVPDSTDLRTVDTPEDDEFTGSRERKGAMRRNRLALTPVFQDQIREFIPTEAGPVRIQQR